MSSQNQSFFDKLRSPFPQFLRWDGAMLFFRVAVSTSLIYIHGISKVADFDGLVAKIPDPLGIGTTMTAAAAVLGDFIAPLFVIFGLFTRFALIPMLGVTLVALFFVHASDPWTVKDVPLMYTLAYLLIFFMGPGKYSLDYRLTGGVPTPEVPAK